LGLVYSSRLATSWIYRLTPLEFNPGFRDQGADATDQSDNAGPPVDFGELHP
jgi:hypothetical protein